MYDNYNIIHKYREKEGEGDGEEGSCVIMDVSTLYVININIDNILQCLYLIVSFGP